MIISTKDGLRAMTAKVLEAEFVAFDTETTGLEYDREMVGFSLAFGTDEGEGFYVPVRHMSGDENLSPRFVASWLAGVIRDSKGMWVMHNAKFDLATLQNDAVDVWPLHGRLHDTVVASWLVSSPVGNGLKALVKHHLDYQMQEFSSFDKQYKKKAALVPVAEMAPYAIDDVVQLLRLYPILMREVEKIPRLPDIYRRVEMPVLWEILQMEKNGFMIDKKFLKEAAIKLDLSVAERERAICGQLRLPPEEVKLGSTQWLSKTLIDEMRVWGMPPEGRGKTGHFSTATANLEKWSLAQIPGTTAAGKEIAASIVNLRKYSKLRSTYTLTLIDYADADGRIHASFNQTGTATGRFSSSGPNLQNIPRPTSDPNLPQIRGAFIARPGFKIIDIDYSQIELRLMAHFSRDPNMLRIYSEGGDIHQMTADACGCSRQHAKGINFGLLYRMWYKKLAIVLGIPEADARMYWDRYFRQYPGVARFQDTTEEKAAFDGYITTLIGRRRLLPDIHSGDKMKASMARRQSINTKIQGSAGDLIKLGMRNIGTEIRRRGWQDRLLTVSQVHDELIFECEESLVEEAAQMVRNKLETVVELRVPLVAEPSVGSTWLEAK